MTLLNRLDRSLLQMLPLLEHSADALERGLGEAAAQEAAQLRALSDLLCEILGKLPQLAALKAVTMLSDNNPQQPGQFAGLWSSDNRAAQILGSDDNSINLTGGKIDPGERSPKQLRAGQTAFGEGQLPNADRLQDRSGEVASDELDPVHRCLVTVDIAGSAAGKPDIGQRAFGQQGADHLAVLERYPAERPAGKVEV